MGRGKRCPYMRHPGDVLRTEASALRERRAARGAVPGSSALVRLLTGDPATLLTRLQVPQARCSLAIAPLVVRTVPLNGVRVLSGTQGDPLIPESEKHNGNEEVRVCVREGLSFL